MKKNIIIMGAVLVMIVGAIFVFSERKGTNDNEQLLTSDEENKGGSSIEDVCNYFPKELIESAIGKPIVKVEKSQFTTIKSCAYYTFYSETYDHTPYGDKPGGTPIMVVYDDEDFAKDRITNEKHGSIYGTDASIGMDNYVVRGAVGEIWMVALNLGGDKYIRMHFIHDAATGEDLVKIAKKFAEVIK